jgi:hypothetical protein
MGRSADILAEHERLAALALAARTDELVVVPVRHHSPACALQLHRRLRALRPSAVLIEGPRSFDALLPSLGHADAEAPFAVHCHVVLAGGNDDDGRGDDGRRRAAWYPFCDHSPELVALRTGLALGVPVHFVDLDYDEQCQLEADVADRIEADSLLHERHLRRSEHLQLLAARLGCRDHEELWEHLFEVPAVGETPERHDAQVLAYCALARRDSSDRELAADGTLAREAEMAWHVQQALAARGPGAGPVVVVVGGFHAVVLPQLVRDRVPRPVITGPRVLRHDQAVVRYAFDRLERLHGYAAGMQAPRWQQEVWQRLVRQHDAGGSDVARARDEAALQLLGEVAEELREKHRLPVPMPTLVAAFEQLQRLVRLRGRAAATVDDVRDALGTFVKGDADADGSLVRAVGARALTGNAVGRVPAGASTPPLLRDFHARARRQRLKIDDTEPRKLSLDLYRRPEHRRTSRLLHGLVLLGVPFATRTAGPDFVAGRQLERLQEHWHYACTPATEAALVEAAMHGTTVPEAVARRFLDKLAALAEVGQARDARIAAAMLSHGCVLGLHEHMPRLLADLRQAIAADADFAAVVAAAGTMALLHESREPLEARAIEELPAVLAATYERALFLARNLPTAPPDARPLVRALQQLQELVASNAGRQLDAEAFHDLLAHLRRQHPDSCLRGATAGLLHGAGDVAAADVLGELGGSLRGRERAADAVAFLRGLLTTARELAWQEPGVLQRVDEVLHDWDDAEFVHKLPELRLAFAALTPNETDRVARALGPLLGGESIGPLVRHDLAAGEVQANLQLSARVRQLLAADGLAAWSAS